MATTLLSGPTTEVASRRCSMIPPRKLGEPRPKDAPASSGVVRIDVSPSTIVTTVLVVVGLWVAIRLLPVILVLVTALIIVGALNPVVQWLEARRLRRGLSIAVVFVMLLVISALVVTLTIPKLVAQVTSLIDQEPALRARLVTRLAASPLTASLAESLRTIQYGALMKSSADLALAFTARAVEAVAYGLGSVFLAFYVMIDRDRLRGGLFAIVPRTHHIRLSRVMMNLESIVGGYIRGQVITCVLMAVFTFIVLTVCGVANALAIAVFGGIADVLPYVGIFLTIGPAVVAALAKGPTVTVLVLALMLAYEEFESRVLMPVVYGRALRLPSSAVLFSLIVGATLLGVVGALLALPVAAAILMLIEELRVELPGETELDEDAEVRKKDDRGEQEYERRTEGMPAEQAAAVAVEMSKDRKMEEGSSHASPQASPPADKQG